MSLCHTVPLPPRREVKKREGVEWSEEKIRSEVKKREGVKWRKEREGVNWRRESGWSEVEKMNEVIEREWVNEWLNE